MSITLSQNLRLTQTQQLVLTPQLQQAIKLLQLNQLELAAMVTQEMETNPVLEEFLETPGEETEESASSPEEGPSTAPETDDRRDSREAVREMDWNQYCENRGVTGSSRSGYDQDEANAWDYNLTRPQTLADHLLWQLQMTPSLSRDEQLIGAVLVHNISDDGYLESPVADVAAAGGYPLETVGRVLGIIQQFDPVGIGARDLSECLLLQMAGMGIDNHLNRAIVTSHLDLLQNKNYKKISRLLKVDEVDVITAIKTILTLDPKPGRQYSGSDPQAIIPDLYVFKHEGQWTIVMNDDRLPRLSISRYYRELADRQGEFNHLTRNYLAEKIRSAQWLLKSIEQRQRTIHKVMQSIITFQRDFFDRGPHHLRPLILRDVAGDIAMHESTVSRVTQNKYVQTPHGIFELKYFFNSSINQGDGDIASESVKQKILEIIANESPTKPVSDKAIAAQLARQFNISIARRTIAKYRDLLGILSSNRRKKIM
ncbi:MAG: RNA polymerase factor sigma-54 [Deltaproteobacteria bacterium]|nr:RNA polymerase factor sigma-54 [Candidatus Anaeroferrophillacea bacterium]